MHINQIQTFIVITKSGSLAGASELLHVTPAALNQRIKQFEGGSGKRSLNEQARNETISARVSIYGHALPISKEVENLFSSVKNVDVNEENITLAIGNAFNPNDISKFSLSHSALSYGVDVSSLHLGTNRFVLIGENATPRKSDNYKVTTPNIKELIASLPLSSIYKFIYTD